MMEVEGRAIAAGLRALGLDGSSIVVVHSSLRSFGQVVGGAAAVCRALVDTCGTVLVPAGTWDLTGLPAPPGLVRPDNAFRNARTWAEFDQELQRAVPFSFDLPVDRELGAIPETMRRHFPYQRSAHPLLSYLAVGPHARKLMDAQRSDWPLGPIESLADMGGDVLLLGTTHSSNTAIHVAEQHLGRSRFYRYAKVAAGSWAELPNIPGQSHRFDEIEPSLTPLTREVWIGGCRARRIPAGAVLETTKRLIAANPRALLCEDPACRCGAALRQYQRQLSAKGRSTGGADPA